MLAALPVRGRAEYPRRVGVCAAPLDRERSEGISLHPRQHSVFAEPPEKMRDTPR